MAAANDKARQYLEKSIPDLKEFERKNIFSKVIPLSFNLFFCLSWNEI